MKFESNMLTSRGKPRKPPHKKMIEMSIKNFEERGFSSHSPFGHFLAHICNHCVRKRIPFTLMYVPGSGWFIKKSSSFEVEGIDRPQPDPGGSFG